MGHFPSRNRALSIPPNLLCDFLILALPHSQRQVLSSGLFLMVFCKKKASLNAVLVLPALELYINAIKTCHTCIQLLPYDTKSSRLLWFVHFLHPLEPVVGSHPLFIRPFPSCWMDELFPVQGCRYVVLVRSRAFLSEHRCAHSFWIYT